ncbi:hypothetical protein HDU82_009211, partial [Entophlyctis luteolus]
RQWMAPPSESAPATAATADAFAARASPQWMYPLDAFVSCPDPPAASSPNILTGPSPALVTDAVAARLSACSFIEKGPEGVKPEVLERPELKESDKEYQRWYENIISAEEEMTSALMSTTLPLRYNRNLLALIILRLAAETTRKAYQDEGISLSVLEFLREPLTLSVDSKLHSIFHLNDLFALVRKQKGGHVPYDDVFEGVGCLEAPISKGVDLSARLLDVGKEILLVSNRPKYEKYYAELMAPILSKMQQKVDSGFRKY